MQKDNMIKKLDFFENRINKWQFLTGKTLKIIASIAMFVDHFTKTTFTSAVGIMFSSEQIPYEVYLQAEKIKFSVLLNIGKMAFPIYCFLLVEGFCHTRSKKKYLISLAIFALLSEIPFDLCIWGTMAQRRGTFPLYWGYQNVFFTLLLGASSLCLIEHFYKKADDETGKIKSICFQSIGPIVATAIATLIRSDYGATGVICIVLLYLTRRYRILQIICIVLTVGIFPLSLYGLLLCVAILLYNGKRGSIRHKYIYYTFYPLHLLALYFISIYYFPVA